MLRDQHERRRAPRVRANFPIELTFRGQARPAVIRDLSENGVCCAYPVAIDEMTLVELRLRLPDLPEDRVHPIRGAIVRCEKLEGSGYDIAIYFTEVDVATRAALRDFVAGVQSANA